MKLTTKQLKQMVKQVITEAFSERHQERYGLDWRGLPLDSQYDELAADSRAVEDENLRMQSMHQAGKDEMIKEVRSALHAFADVLEEFDNRDSPWDSLKDDYISLFNIMQSRGIDLEWLMMRIHNKPRQGTERGQGMGYQQVPGQPWKHET